jgi:hypothetical protein
VGKISRQAGFAVLAAGKFEIGCTHCNNPASTSSGSEMLEESGNLQLSGSMFNVQSSMLRGKEIVEDLEAALEQSCEIAGDLALKENES